MTIEMDLSDVRRDYEAHGITRGSMDPDPLVQFGQWLQRARDLELLDATAMTLATCDASGQPSARVVLLKHFDAQGFCWYTDSRSQKGRELEQNPNAALLFHWRDLSRQVRVHGPVERLPADDAERYFALRPEGSRYSAAASQQSAPVASVIAVASISSRSRARCSHCPNCTSGSGSMLPRVMPCAS